MKAISLAGVLVIGMVGMSSFAQVTTMVKPAPVQLALPPQAPAAPIVTVKPIILPNHAAPKLTSRSVLKGTTTLNGQTQMNFDGMSCSLENFNSGLAQGTGFSTDDVAGITRAFPGRLQAGSCGGGLLSYNVLARKNLIQGLINAQGIISGLKLKQVKLTESVIQSAVDQAFAGLKIRATYAKLMECNILKGGRI